MNIKPIRTRAHYKAALNAAESLMDAHANTPEGDRLGVLVTRVEAYERRQFQTDLPACLF
jgi:antitoxin component HigA of HigAB toxin-antitoxin module